MAMAAASVGLVAGPASAVDSDPQLGEIHVLVEVEAGITLTSTTEDIFLKGAPGQNVDNSVDGVFEDSFKVLTNSSTGYNVTVQAESAVLLPDEVGNSHTIPISALSVNDGIAYVPLSTDVQTLWNHPGAPSAALGDDYEHNFNLDIPNVQSGHYQVTLEYIAHTI